MALITRIEPVSHIQHHPRENLTASSWYQLLDNVYPISDREFDELWHMHPESRDSIMMFGKSVTIPRYQKLYGHDVEYRYSGKNMVSAPVTNSVMATTLTWVNQYEPQHQHNGMLVNWYRDGSHYMGMHSDDERDLTRGAAIYSFSFGAERVFRISNKATGEKTDLLLRHGSLLIMGGAMQQEFKHGLPARAGCKTPRINFTIRSFTTQKQPRQT